MDEVTPVRVPTVVEESARDLTRCREAARADLMRARHRLSKLLLRNGIVYSDGKAWTRAHDYWLLKQPAVLPALAGTQAAFDGRLRDGGADRWASGPPRRGDHGHGA